jgi:hypothetical protein
VVHRGGSGRLDAPREKKKQNDTGSTRAFDSTPAHLVNVLDQVLREPL